MQHLLLTCHAMPPWLVRFWGQQCKTAKLGVGSDKNAQILQYLRWTTARKKRGLLLRRRSRCTSGSGFSLACLDLGRKLCQPCSLLCLLSSMLRLVEFVFCWQAHFCNAFSQGGGFRACAPANTVRGSHMPVMGHRHASMSCKVCELANWLYEESPPELGQCPFIFCIHCLKA